MGQYYCKHRYRNKDGLPLRTCFQISRRSEAAVGGKREIVDDSISVSYRVCFTEARHCWWCLLMAEVAEASGIHVIQVYMKKTNQTVSTMSSKRKKCRWMPPMQLLFPVHVSFRKKNYHVMKMNKGEKKQILSSMSPIVSVE